MKFLLSLFALTFSASLFAYEGFRCIPSLRESRIQVLVRGENIEVRVINGGGYAFMPQFGGPASQFNLAFFKMQAEDLKGLGEQFYFSWPKDKCELDSKNFSITCNGPANGAFNGIGSYGISTTEITEKLQDQTWVKRRFSISVEKDNLYFVKLEFFTQNCETFY